MKKEPLPTSPVERCEFDLLLHEHKLARDDVRNFFSVVATLVSVTVLVLTGAVTALVVAQNNTSNTSNTNSSTRVTDWVWGFAPLIPIGLLAIMASVADSAGIRSRTLHYIEERLIANIPDRSHVLSYRLVRPVGRWLAPWIIANSSVAILLSALTAVLVYFVEGSGLRIGLGVLYGVVWLIVMLFLIHGYYSRPKWLELRQTRPRSPADIYDV